MRPAALLVALAAALPAPALAAEHWAALSKTAQSITGDVTFTPQRITFQNGQSLPLVLVGAVPGFQEMGATVTVTLYRVTAPADPKLLRGNRLCGGAEAVPATYVAVWSPRPMAGDHAPRSIEVFSGAQPPRAAGGAESCGTFNYDSGG
jgi:hypothetical protein